MCLDTCFRICYDIFPSDESESYDSEDDESNGSSDFVSVQSDPHEDPGVSEDPNNREAPTDPDARKKFRIDQIYSYFTFRNEEVVAEKLYELKDCLKLTGDFVFLDVLKVRAF